MLNWWHVRCWKRVTTITMQRAGIGSRWFAVGQQQWYCRVARYAHQGFGWYDRSAASASPRSLQCCQLEDRPLGDAAPVTCESRAWTWQSVMVSSWVLAFKPTTTESTSRVFVSQGELTCEAFNDGPSYVVAASGTKVAIKAMGDKGW